MRIEEFIDLTPLTEEQRFRIVFAKIENLDEYRSVMIYCETELISLLDQLLRERQSDFSYTFIRRGPGGWQARLEKKTEN